ncbi:MAG: phosphoribosyl-dephospho-CoA transferase [Mycobacterium sp.]|nr:phosphoribosyl-dephospho-CoA transferase [Mycobacterium sp.]
MFSARPYDLLRLSGAHVLPPDAPPWASSALIAAPWVVVRRAAAPMGRIGVGVRGTSRSERYATDVDPDDVREVVAPEDLAHVAPPSGRELAVMCTLHAVRPLLDDTGLTWGPTGSVGFELATGACTATPESDLDLLIRVPDGSPATLNLLAAAYGELRRLAVRVDCQVETPTGAVALAELVGGQSDVMVRTAEGPRLVPRAVAVS